MKIIKLLIYFLLRYLNKIGVSLRSSPGSSGFEIVVDLAGSGSRVERHVVALAFFAFHLNVDVLDFVDGQRLTFA